MISKLIVLIVLLNGICTQDNGSGNDIEMEGALVSPEEASQIEEAMIQQMKNSGRSLGLLEAAFAILVDNSAAGIRKRKERIKYFLRHKEFSLWSEVQRNGSNVGQSTGWYDGGEVKVIIHGLAPKTWVSSQENIRQQGMFDIGNAYGSLQKHNLFIVDWTIFSAVPIHKYHEAAASTYMVGEDVAAFLMRLQQSQLIPNWELVHLIGHSLGAHVAGVAGHFIEKLTGSKVGRITGLDPAGPLFQKDGEPISNLTRALDAEDGKFVDVLHTNMEPSGNPVIAGPMACLGTAVPSGHADFYPDGGRKQRVCLHEFTYCSHQQSVQYFKQSITSGSKFTACPCETWDDYLDGKCKCEPSDAVQMGDSCQSSANGKFHFRVRPE